MVGNEAQWFFFPTVRTVSPVEDWGIGIPPDGRVAFDHLEKLVLSLYETPDGEVFGSLKNPNWKGEIPLPSLAVRDHQSKGIVLYGLDGNGAAVSILLQ